ncbi:MAG: aspartate aminotransferase family protein [Myxococcales bacterium]|nr:aspartate aminotransferase family protein [Myxococcales bacterium]
MGLPTIPLSHTEIFRQLRAFQIRDTRWSTGQTFGLTFVGDEAERGLVEEAYRLYQWENALDPMLFPSLVQMEKQVIDIALDHLGGGSQSCGSFTSGGTESVMLAVKSARDFARKANPGLEKPQMLVPVTAHPCFHKAAHYLGVESVPIPVDPQTGRAVVEAYRTHITNRTVLLCASAPSFGIGAIDPIAEIGEIALSHNIPFHVDGCIGAFMLPLLRDLGAKIPPFDLSVPGVTSISMDFHKYAMISKGASVVLYNDAELWRNQTFVWSDWNGYALVNPTVQSSRSGGPLAATWAALHYLGAPGYRSLAKDLLSATQHVKERVKNMPYVDVVGDPVVPLVAIRGNERIIFHIADRMKERGWDMHPQFSHGMLPESVHLTITPRNIPQIGQFLDDLAQVSELPDPPLPAALSTLAAMLPYLTEDALTPANVRALMDTAEINVDSPQTKFGHINVLLNQLKPALRDRLFLLFYEQLFAGRT